MGCRRRRGGVCGAFGNDLFAQAMVRGVDAVKAQLVHAWRRHQRDQASDEVEGVEHQMRGAIQNHRAMHMIGGVKLIESW